MSNDATYAAAISGLNQSAQIAYDSSATKKQNRRMIDFWKMQNDYNSPRQQMQRLQEAGLNPNLIYGDSVSGATGRADSVGTPSRPSNINPLGDMLQYQNVRQRSAQEDLLQQQIQTEMERKRLTSNQADKVFFEAANQNYADQDNPIVRHTLEGMKLRNNSVRQDVIRKQIENDIKDRTKASQVERIFWEAQNAKAIESRTLKNNQLLELQRQFLNLGLDRNSPWYAKIFGNLINKLNQRK